MHFFEQLFGFPETNPDTVYQYLSLEGNYLHSKANGKTYRAGRLEVVSLADLRTRKQAGGGAPGTIEQVVGDVSKLHQRPENNGAFFQAASQFNLLEMVNPDVSPRRGISGYSQDHTQGPACAVACAAGTVQRNYFAPVSTDQRGQCGTEQIDTLASIGDYFDNPRLGLWEMQNGYALFNQRGLRAVDLHLERLNETELDDLRSRLQIGVQWQTQVTSVGPGQVVTQGYCSALPVGYHPFAGSPDWERFCRLILEATYEATLLAAAENARLTGNTTCYLTLVGGGVFANRREWILGAVERAFLLGRALGLRVVLVSYGGVDVGVSELVRQLNG